MTISSTNAIRITQPIIGEPHSAADSKQQQGQYTWRGCESKAELRRASRRYQARLIDLLVSGIVPENAKLFRCFTIGKGALPYVPA
jgi:hypothetical protein